LNNTTANLTKTIIYDTTAPTTTISPDGSVCFTGTKTVTLTCADGTGAGCATIGYKVIPAALSCDASGLTVYS
jgi:large repetitive protein